MLMGLRAFLAAQGAAAMGAPEGDGAEPGAGGGEGQGDGQGAPPAGGAPAPKPKGQVEPGAGGDTTAPDPKVIAAEALAAWLKAQGYEDPDAAAEALKRAQAAAEAEKTAAQKLTESEGREAKLAAELAERDRRDAFRAACAEAKLTDPKRQDTAYRIATDAYAAAGKTPDHKAIVKAVLTEHDYLLGQATKPANTGADDPAGAGGGDKDTVGAGKLKRADALALMQ
jgi:hypothetical protein